jgi:hypothetical protein
MALRDQPYLPLYVQDFLTDEKLLQCSAESTGVYIRLLCWMHKSADYGKLDLRTKKRSLPEVLPTVLPEVLPQQKGQQILNFAASLVRFLPFDLPVIENALQELIAEDVLQVEGNYLVQKRMVKDAKISAQRVIAGGKGAKKTNTRAFIDNGFAEPFAGNFAAAKRAANTEIEIEIENDNKKGGVGGSENDRNREPDEVETGATIEYLAITAQQRITPAEVTRYWDAFKIHKSGAFHYSRSETMQHFRNWLKIHLSNSKNEKNGKQRTKGDSIGRPGAVLENP